MFKKLIVIENGVNAQCNTLEELVSMLIDKNYYNMLKYEKKEKMRMKAQANLLNAKGVKILESMQKDDEQECFVIKDEVTYILSLLKTNNVMLLERKDANILAKGIDRDKLSGNYIIVNKFAKDLLNNYLINLKKKEEEER